MKKILTLGLTLALSGLINQPLMAKSKDHDDKKHDKKSSKSEKKQSAPRPTVVYSERQRAPISQHSVIVREANDRSPSSKFRPTGVTTVRSRGDYRDSNHNDGRYSDHYDSRYSRDHDRGWSNYE